jgi:hypothetical protein
VKDIVLFDNFSTKERSTVYVRYSSCQTLPIVGDIIDAQGFARWKCKVLKVLDTVKNDDGSTTVEMRVERWIEDCNV